MNTMYGLEAFDIANVPTKHLPVLPPQARPGTAPMRLKAIMHAIILNECTQAAQAADPLPVAMQNLFMVTMRFFHEHGELAMPHDLTATLAAMHRAVYDEGGSRWVLTVIAIDRIEKTSAVTDPAVRRALWAARDIVQPVL